MQPARPVIFARYEAKRKNDGAGLQRRNVLHLYVDYGYHRTSYFVSRKDDDA
jgi:hypothetical protein